MGEPQRISVTFTASVREWGDDRSFTIVPGDDMREYPAIGERITIHRNVGPVARSTDEAAPDLRGAAARLVDEYDSDQGASFDAIDALRSALTRSSEARTEPEAEGGA